MKNSVVVVGGSLHSNQKIIEPFFYEKRQKYLYICRSSLSFPDFARRAPREFGWIIILYQHCLKGLENFHRFYRF